MRMLERWRRNLLAFIRNHTGPALLLCTLFVIGVIFGALAAGSLQTRDKLELVSYLGGVVTGLKNPPVHLESILFRQTLFAKVKMLALLWVLGISVVGVFGVMLLTFLRGLVTGFAVAFMAAEMGPAGVLLATVGHLPQSLIEVPALILAGTASVAFSLQVVRSWREHRRVRNFYPALASYTGTLLAMGALLGVAAVVESYLSPELVRLATSLMKLG